MIRAVLLLCALPLAAAELQVDHVTVCGPVLAPMRAALDRLGIRSDYGGRHSNRATEMAIASFADGSYLELIALQPDADPAAVESHYWTKYMKENAGPCAFAVRVPDVPAEAERLRSTGLTVSETRTSGRTRPDGFRLDWETATVGTEGTGVYFPFLIRDFTPREKRAFPSGKPNNPGIKGVTNVEIAVRDPAEAAKRYHRAYTQPGPLVVFRKDATRVAKFGEGVRSFQVGGIRIDPPGK